MVGTAGAAMLADELRGLANRADADELLDRGGELFRMLADERFASGEGWEAWADSYAEQASGSILVDTGELRASLTDASHRQHIQRRAGDALEVGTKRPTANLHRSGRRGGRGGPMPARDPAPDADRLGDAWLGWVRGHLAGDTPRLGA